MKSLMVPENLDLDELILQHPSTPIGFKKDKVYFVCNAIYTASLELDERTHIHPSKKEKYYVPLHTDIISHYLGSKYYNKVLEWMILAGIIETDNSYLKDFASKGYKYAPQYRFIPGKLVNVEDFILNKKEPFQFKDSKRRKVNRHICSFKKYYNLLTLDLCNAELVNELIYSESSMAYNNNKIVLNLFNNGLSSYHFQDSFGNRLHTPITRLPKTFRSLVRYDGKELAQTDISNSQLFFTLYLLEKKNWKRTKSNQAIWEGVGIKSVPSLISNNTIMSLKISETLTGEESSEQLFYQLVTTGTFYDFFIDKMEGTGFFNAKMDWNEKRERVKSVILKQIYGDEFVNTNRPIVFTDLVSSKERDRRLRNNRGSQWLYKGKNKPLWDSFQSELPTIATVYRHLKSYDYADLARVLQRIESAAVLNHACKEIFRTLGDIPLFTLHDCIVTTVEYIVQVDEIFKCAIEKYIGIRPNTSITYWREYAEMLDFEIDHEIAA